MNVEVERHPEALDQGNRADACAPAGTSLKD